MSGSNDTRGRRDTPIHKEYRVRVNSYSVRRATSRRGSRGQKTSVSGLRNTREPGPENISEWLEKYAMQVSNTRRTGILFNIPDAIRDRGRRPKIGENGDDIYT